MHSDINLTSLRADVTKSAYLEKMLEKTTSSYKFYWLMGIIDEVCSGNTRIDYSRIVAQMAANAWYPTNFFHLSLGLSDQLDSLTWYAMKTYKLGINAKKAEVLRVIEDNLESDKQLRNSMASFIKYVPLRLVRPFYEAEVKQGQQDLKDSGINRPDAYADKLILHANANEPEKAIYRVIPDESALEVSSEWAKFIRNNKQVICGWLDFRLTQYLQARNPSVPAISMKLRPHEQRKLESSKKYWRCVLGLTSLSDIYSGKRFTADNFEKMGSLSIDHFIPWSFVLHDEAWDLIPMFKNANSSKSDSLPAIGRYLQPFCSQQFDAMIAIKEAGLQGKHKEQFESLRAVDSCIDEYSNSDASREAFSKALGNTLIPLYQIALNQGYQVVRYVGDTSYFMIDT